MEEQSEKTVDPADVKKQLEAIAGHEIDVSPDQLINLWLPLGALDYTDGTAAWMRIIFPGRTCNSATLIDASGVSSTGSDGKRVFLLGDFVCLPQVRNLGEPINVLATARSTRPFFLTTTHTVVDNPNNPNANDVQITVFAWDARGTAAPNVTFDWRCRVVSNPVIV
jgi:hypothetical protein